MVEPVENKNRGQTPSAGIIAAGRTRKNGLCLQIVRHCFAPELLPAAIISRSRIYWLFESLRDSPYMVVSRKNEEIIPPVAGITLMPKDCGRSKVGKKKIREKGGGEQKHWAE